MLSLIVINQLTTKRKVPEVPRSKLQRGGSLKSHFNTLFVLYT
jgi:hypothetical protein